MVLLSSERRRKMRILGSLQARALPLHPASRGALKHKKTLSSWNFPESGHFEKSVVYGGMIVQGGTVFYGSIVVYGGIVFYDHIKVYGGMVFYSGI